MQVSKLNRDRVMLSASRWNVCREYFDPLYNYLIYGYEPGSFWAAALANDFMAAMQHSHPSNSIPHLSHAVGWIRDVFPQGSYGDYRSVNYWCNMDAHLRRQHLEQHHILMTEQEEVMAILKGQNANMPEPMLY